VPRDRREAVFCDDQDNQVFIETLSEACERCGWAVAQTGIVIFKMHFFGVVPGPNLAEWPPDQLSRFMILFGGASTNQTPFRYTVEKLCSFDSIQSLSRFLAQEPNPLELAYQERVLKEFRGTQGIRGQSVDL